MHTADELKTQGDLLKNLAWRKMPMPDGLTTAGIKYFTIVELLRKGKDAGLYTTEDLATKGKAAMEAFIKDSQDEDLFYDILNAFHTGLPLVQAFRREPTIENAIKALDALYGRTE